MIDPLGMMPPGQLSFRLLKKSLLVSLSWALMLLSTAW
jgi:hypothetical protein